ncbi:MAG: zinc-dependent alcohol dehydrogenase family protein [Rhodospirillales bacterium]|nr:zinc-dependent alcohol dehydrogenase family protein [Rhodospirillales bacterium]
MKVQMIRTFGGPEVFEEALLPDPSAKAGEVLVRIVAASVNPVDYKLRRAGPAIAPALPAVLGCDFAGIVETIGTGVEGFTPGDAVFGCAGGVKGMPGTYAEMIAADARLVAKKPAKLPFRDAAALPLVTITASDALQRSGVGSGQTVLIHGGAGGVGHIAIQLAKARGAWVAATVSNEFKATLARSLGADETIDYRAESVDDYVERLTQGRGFDVVFDATGGSDIASSFAAARPSGQVVTIVSQYTADLSPMHAKGLSLHVVFMLLPMLTGEGRDEHGRILAAAAALADSGRLKPIVDSVRFTLADIAAAHRRLETGQATGKVVIDVSAIPTSSLAAIEGGAVNV